MAGSPSTTPGSPSAKPSPPPSATARRAELISLTGSVADLVGRITTMADATAAGDEDVSAMLYEIERSLTGAHRTLSRLTDALRNP